MKMEQRNSATVKTIQQVQTKYNRHCKQKMLMKLQQVKLQTLLYRCLHKNEYPNKQIIQFQIFSIRLLQSYQEITVIIMYHWLTQINIILRTLYHQINKLIVNNYFKQLYGTTLVRIEHFMRQVSVNL